MRFSHVPKNGCSFGVITRKKTERHVRNACKKQNHDLQQPQNNTHAITKTHNLQIIAYTN